MQSGLLICFVVAGAAAFGQQYTSSVSCSFSPQSITAGGSTNVTVSVSCASNITGGVNVYAGSNGLCGSSLNGSSASCTGGSTLSVGSYSITASYGGDQYCSSATSSSCGTLTVTQSQTTPTVSTWPTASAITWGLSLASSTLSGGTASVGGTFAWTTPSTIAPAGAQTESVTFTPSDTTHYTTVTGSTSVSVNATTFSSPTINTGVQVINGGGPALVLLGNGLYSQALELIYVSAAQDLALAYSRDGLHYTYVGRLSVPGGSGVAELDCTPVYADHCGVAAASFNGQLYVAYNDISCNCLHVLAGTPISGSAVFTWTDVHDEPAYQLVSTPTILATTDGSNRLIVRYGTTVGNDDAYSTVYDPNAKTPWSTQASNGSSPTQSTLFAINGTNYAIDGRTNGGPVYITQIDDNGVAVSGTTYPLGGGYVHSALGFSSTTYNPLGNPNVFVASRPTSSNELQLLISSVYDYFEDGEVWGDPSYSNIQLNGYEVNNYPGDFATTIFPPPPSSSAAIVVVYRGDSNGDLYATSGIPPAR